MYNIEGCLGVTVGTATSIDEVISTIQRQIPLTDKKVRTMRNALPKLQQGSEYYVEYGGSGCTVRRL